MLQDFDEFMNNEEGPWWMLKYHLLYKDCGTWKYSAEVRMCIKHLSLIQTDDFN